MAAPLLKAMKTQNYTYEGNFSLIREGFLSHDKNNFSNKESLDRMQIDCIDLYIVHWPICDIAMSYLLGAQTPYYLADPKIDAEGNPISHTVTAFRELKRLQDAGKIKHIGVSNFGVKQL